MDDLDNFVTFLIFTTIATVGGMVKYLKSMDRFKLQKFLIEAVASGMVGLIVSLACVSFGLDQHLTGALAGLAGFLGADVVKSMFGQFVKDKTGIDVEKDTEEKTP